MKLFAIRFCQRIGDRLAAAKARMDGMCWYSCDLSPLCYRHALSPQRKNAAFSSVSGLFLSAGPAAVLRRVAFLIVDAVNRMLRGGTPTHIFKERLEGISPALTHRNAAAAVSAVAAIVLIVTTLNHTNPNPILGAFVHPVFDPKAAAASSMSTVQIPKLTVVIFPQLQRHNQARHLNFLLTGFSARSFPNCCWERSRKGITP